MTINTFTSGVDENFTDKLNENFDVVQYSNEVSSDATLEVNKRHVVTENVNITIPTGANPGDSLEIISFDAIAFVNNPEINIYQNGSVQGGGDSLISYRLKSSFDLNASVQAVSISPDNQYLAMAGTNGSVVIYNIDTGQYVTELTRNNSTIYGVSFSPDGNYIAYGGSGNDTVYVHNVSDWSLYGTQSNANQTIRSVAFSKDSQYIGFTSYQESFIAPIDRLFDETTFTETSGNCYDIAFSNNNDYVAYGAQDENVYVHDVSTGNLVTTLSGAFSEVLSVDFSNDGQYIAYGETRRDVTVHNVSDWSEEAKIDVDGDVEDLEFTPDSSYLVAVTDRGTVYIIDTNSWSTVSTIQKATDDISTVSVSSDGLLMAYGSRDQMVRVHNSEKLNIVPEYVKLVHGKNEWAVTDLVEEI